MTANGRIAGASGILAGWIVPAKAGTGDEEDKPGGVLHCRNRDWSPACLAGSGKAIEFSRRQWLDVTGRGAAGWVWCGIGKWLHLWP